MAACNHSHDHDHDADPERERETARPAIDPRDPVPADRDVIVCERFADMLADGCPEAHYQRYHTMTDCGGFRGTPVRRQRGTLPETHRLCDRCLASGAIPFAPLEQLRGAAPTVLVNSRQGTSRKLHVPGDDHETPRCWFTNHDVEWLVKDIAVYPPGHYEWCGGCAALITRDLIESGAYAPDLSEVIIR